MNSKLLILILIGLISAFIYISGQTKQTELNNASPLYRNGSCRKTDQSCRNKEYHSLQDNWVKDCQCKYNTTSKVYVCQVPGKCQYEGIDIADIYSFGLDFYGGLDYGHQVQVDALVNAYFPNSKLNVTYSGNCTQTKYSCLKSAYPKKEWEALCQANYICRTAEYKNTQNNWEEVCQCTYSHKLSIQQCKINSEFCVKTAKKIADLRYQQGMEFFGSMDYGHMKAVIAVQYTAFE